MELVIRLARCFRPCLVGVSGWLGQMESFDIGFFLIYDVDEWMDLALWKIPGGRGDIACLCFIHDEIHISLIDENSTSFIFNLSRR